MVRILAEYPKNRTLDQINREIDKWVARHTSWTADEFTHRVTAEEELDPSLTGGTSSPYLYGDYRFIQMETADVLLDDLEYDLQRQVAWYRLGYHICPHDARGSEECTWDEVREYGPIPAGLTQFVVGGSA